MRPERNNDDKLLDAAAQVFRDRLSSGSRFQALLDSGSPDVTAADSRQFVTVEPGEINLPHTLRLSRSLESAQPQIGDLPPEPPTMRGRIGAALVQAVRRALFWYTGQIRAFHGLVAEAAHEQITAFQELAARQQRQTAMLPDVLRRLSELEQEHDRQIQELRAEQEEWQRKVTAVEQTIAARQASEESPEADEALLVAHIGAFRGERAEIKSRLTVYAPYAKEAFAATAGAPALDLGCGRGEWLELLRGMDIPASGFDWNSELVQACREMGLDARRGDMRRILSTIPDASLAIVTAFHVLEHISFRDLLEVVDHAVRVLKPGGIAIFETPNPGNIFVSTNNFYLDPTHRHPIPSELLAFVVEARGLRDPKVVPLSPYPHDFHLADHTCPAVQFINDHFYGPQDYGIIGYKV